MVDYKEVGSGVNHRLFVITLEDGTTIDVLYSKENGQVIGINHGRVAPVQRDSEGIAIDKVWTAKEILDREA